MEKTNSLLLVGQLSKITGKTPRALRMYEGLGIMSPAERSSGGYRMYDQRSITQVKYIDQLQLMGLSLTEIQTWVKDFRVQIDNADVGRDIMSVLKELYSQKHRELQEKILALQKIDEQLSSATKFLDGCSTCSQHDIPSSCSTCSEHSSHKEREGIQGGQKQDINVPELVSGLLSIVDP